MAELPEVEYPTEVIAALFGVTKARIRQLTAEGLPKAGRNRYPLVACIRWYIDYWRGRSDGLDDLTKREKRRLLKAQADGQEIKNKVVLGELVPAAEIEESWGRIVLAIRQQMLALADRLPALLETATTAKQRREVCLREIRTVLKALARGAK